MLCAIAEGLRIVRSRITSTWMHAGETDGRPQPGCHLYSKQLAIVRSQNWGNRSMAQASIALRN